MEATPTPEDDYGGAPESSVEGTAVGGGTADDDDDDEEEQGSESESESEGADADPVFAAAASAAAAMMADDDDDDDADFEDADDDLAVDAAADAAREGGADATAYFTATASEGGDGDDAQFADAADESADEGGGGANSGEEEAGASSEGVAAARGNSIVSAFYGGGGDDDDDDDDDAAQFADAADETTEADGDVGGAKSEEEEAGAPAGGAAVAQGNSIVSAFYGAAAAPPAATTPADDRAVGPEEYAEEEEEEEEEEKEEKDEGAVMGEAVMGEAVMGETVMGEAVMGEAVMGEAVTDEAVTDEAVTDEAAMGDAAMGDAATGDAAMGDAATGEAADGAEPHDKSQEPESVTTSCGAREGAKEEGVTALVEADAAEPSAEGEEAATAAGGKSEPSEEKEDEGAGEAGGEAAPAAVAEGGAEEAAIGGSLADRLASLAERLASTAGTKGEAADDEDIPIAELAAAKASPQGADAAASAAAAATTEPAKGSRDVCVPVKKYEVDATGRKFHRDAKGVKRRLCDFEGCVSHARSAGRCPKHGGPRSRSPRKSAGAAPATKKRKRGAEEDEEDKDEDKDEDVDEEAAQRAPYGPLCILPGCGRKRHPKASICCARHKALADQLAEALDEWEDPDTKSLKTLFKKGDKVYAPYWEPEDKDREGEASWYLGTVTSYNTGGQKPLDNKYGPVRYYNVNYEDGDRSTNIPDHLVYPEEDYELISQLEEENEKRKRKIGWRGVKNYLDLKSKDHWARCVGWFIASIDDEDRVFPTLVEALRARDSWIVTVKGLSIRKSELNLPEEWDELFEMENSKGAKRRKIEVVEEDEEAKAARLAREAPCRALDGCTKRNVPNCDGYCLEHFKLLEPDQAKVEAVVAEIRRQVECRTEGCSTRKLKKFDNYCRKCYREKDPEGYAAVIEREEKEKAEKRARKEAREAAKLAKDLLLEERAREGGVEPGANGAAATLEGGGEAAADANKAADGALDVVANASGPGDAVSAVVETNAADEKGSEVKAAEVNGNADGADAKAGDADAEATAAATEPKATGTAEDVVATENGEGAPGEGVAAPTAGSGGAETKLVGDAVAAAPPVSDAVKAAAATATAPPVSNAVQAAAALLAKTRTPAKRTPKKLTPAQMCKLEGCEKRKKRDCGGYCGEHKWLALRLGAPIAAAEDKRALKPAYEVNSKVYAAYWHPEDFDQEAKPTWRPAVVTHRKEGEDEDEKYGAVSRYNVTYDNDDRLRGVEERYVCSAEDHELRLRLDVLDPNGGRSTTTASWRKVKGVRNATDKKSKDSWAKHVGWYIATIDGKQHNFASLKEALRAYDAATVRRKGLKTEQEDLHLPEEWEGLFGKKGNAEKEKKVGAVAKRKSLTQEKEKKGPLVKKVKREGGAAANEKKPGGTRPSGYLSESGRYLGKAKAAPPVVPQSVERWLASLPPHLEIKLMLALPPIKTGRMGMTLRHDDKTFGLPMIVSLADDSPFLDTIPPFVMQNYCIVGIEDEDDGAAEVRNVKDLTRELNARRREDEPTLQEVRLVGRRGVVRPAPQSAGPLYV